MKKTNRNLVVGVVILAVLAGFWFALGQTTQEKKSSNAVPDSLWQSFSWQDIQELTIRRVLFKKIDNTWKVEKDNNFFPITSGAIDQIENFFADSQLKGKVAQTTVKHTQLEVTAIQGIHVTASTSSKKVVDVIVGKSGIDFSSCYIRKSDEDTVYLATPNCKFTFDKNEWRNLSIMPAVNNLQIEKISIEQDGAFRELLKQGETIEWKEGDIDLDAEKVKNLMSAITGTQAANILLSSEETADAFTTPKATIQLDIKDHDSITIIVGTEASGSEYYIQNPTKNEYVYTVSKTRVNDQWLIPIDELKKD
ncbi:MAG: DUF4340 domain-containing protein [Candidatus Jacksonbacteria bacterium]|jgi:hypothetical protein|nr:DUF4340 domain-containing protein [Candidatus Jacksonbacteria bacterium]